MRFCTQCGARMTRGQKCPQCGFSPYAPARKGPPLGALSIALLPTLLGVLTWAYHEYELTRSADSMRASFETISAQVHKASTTQHP